MNQARRAPGSSCEGKIEASLTSEKLRLQANFMTFSVLIATWRRTCQLKKCLQSLREQSVSPDEVLVIWQADDRQSAEVAEAMGTSMSFALRVLHSSERGVVPAENIGLLASSGDIIALLDDDAIAPPDWVAKHKAHYFDPEVGAVGGPMMNFRINGIPFPRRSKEPVGLVARTGTVIGNMYDWSDTMLALPVREVDHLVGANMSLRRRSFQQFEQNLREYWQMFEVDACLTVRRNGYKVLFDPDIPIRHFPTNTAFDGIRNGDMNVKIFAPAFNHGFILAKHMPSYLGIMQVLFACLKGSVSCPGLLATCVAVVRHGKPLHELNILMQTTRSRLAGWCLGMAISSQQPPQTQNAAGASRGTL